MKMAKITNAELVEKFESLVDRLISAEKDIEEHAKNYIATLSNGDLRFAYNFL